MNVPFIDLKRDRIDQLSLINDVQEIFVQKSFSGGEFVTRLESSLENVFSVNHCVGCANGTDALQIALKSIGVGPGDKVIIPNLTFWATCEAVVNVGAEPIVIDVETETFAIDPNILSSAIDKYRASCVILVNLYGVASKYLNEIVEICQSKGVLLVGDNAQAAFVEVDNRPIFSYFDVSTISFYPAKVLGASGDAGAIFYSNKDLADKARSLINHGRESHYGYKFFGYNSRIDSIEACYLIHRLKYIKESIEKRVECLNEYKDKIELNVYKNPANILSNGYLNVTLCDSEEQRISLETLLANNKIGYGRVYPSTIMQQKPALNQQNLLNGNADSICSRIINLPVFPGITSSEISYVVEKVNQL